MRPVTVCPVCAAPADGAAVAYRRESDFLRRCGACGSLFADPQLEPHELPAVYEEDFYNDRTARDGRPVWGKAAPPLAYETCAGVLLSRYPRLAKPGVRVLDYGCGLGSSSSR